jgi:hypothetical protein
MSALLSKTDIERHDLACPLCAISGCEQCNTAVQCARAAAPAPRSATPPRRRAACRPIMQTNHAPYKCDQIEEIPVAGGPAEARVDGQGPYDVQHFLKGDKEIIYASTHEAAPRVPDAARHVEGLLLGRLGVVGAERELRSRR